MANECKMPVAKIENLNGRPAIKIDGKSYPPMMFIFSDNDMNKLDFFYQY